MSKTRFVAGNHICWFSRKPELENKTVNEAIKSHPEYIYWCLNNLHHLRFATGLKKRIKEANKTTHPQQVNK